MPSADAKILEFNQHQKSNETPSIIYEDLKFLIKRIHERKSTFEKPSTTKEDENILCERSVSRMWTFDGGENKHYEAINHKKRN